MFVARFANYEKHLTYNTIMKAKSIVFGIAASVPRCEN